MSKTIVAVRHFGLGGRKSLETAVKKPRKTPIFLMGILNNEGLLDSVISIHMKAEKWHLLSHEALLWREFWLIIQANKIGDKIHCTASKGNETWLNYP